MNEREYAARNGKHKKTLAEYFQLPMEVVKGPFYKKAQAILLREIRRMIRTRPYRWPKGDTVAPDPESWREEFEGDE